MTKESLLIRTIRTDCPFFRAGYALFIIPIASIFAMVIMMLEIHLIVRLLLAIICAVLGTSYFITAVASIRVDGSNLTITLPFKRWTCCIDDISAFSKYVIPSSCYCSFTIKLRSGERRKFWFQAMQTNVGFFSDTVKALDEWFSALKTDNLSDDGSY
jgi:hypothetical protein